MARRANGEGSIYRIDSGKWRVQVEVPVAPGRPRRRLIRHCATKSEAVAKLQELRDEAATGDVETRTVGQLITAWMNDGRQDWAPATVAQREAARKRLDPLEALIARELRPQQVSDFFRELECGPRIRQVAFDVLRMACAFGVAMEYLTRNPCAPVRRPKVRRKDIRPFEPVEADKILTALKGTRWYAFAVLSLTCGTRQAELFGLKWDRVDLTSKVATITVDEQAMDVGGKVHVRQPKTEAGVRTFDVPPIAKAALQAHRAIMLKEGHAGSPLVFPAPEGGYMDRGRLRTRVWQPLLKTLGLDHRGAHHLRHTYATLALGAGVPAHVVSRVLGHARVSTTLDLYAHALPSQTAEASAVMQKLFGAVG